MDVSCAAWTERVQMVLSYSEGGKNKLHVVIQGFSFEKLVFLCS